MTDAGHKVLTGFVRLSCADRDGVMNAVNRFLAAAPPEHAVREQQCEEALVGPVDSARPCFRRSWSHT